MTLQPAPPSSTRRPAPRLRTAPHHEFALPDVRELPPAKQPGRFSAGW